MSQFRSDFMKAVEERGLLHQCSAPEALDAAAHKGMITGYVGCDCTAPSLHAGNLASLTLLRLLQQTGHKPIVLVGGATTKVGDPSDQDQSRPLLSSDEIDANIAGIRKVYSKILKFGDGPTDAILVNNADWLDDIGYLAFLREIGRHFSINRMVNFDFVKRRLSNEQNLTFLEFNYMLLQAYDFLELSRRYGCTLQMGGSDQWGNIINGVDLGRRADGKELFALTTELIATSDGRKMGKTAEGAVWLNEDMLSPYDYWQYWRNTPDPDVSRFMKIFTDLPLDEITRYENAEGAEINEAKKILATEATALIHGRANAEASARTAEETFERGGAGEDLPTVTVGHNTLGQGITVVELLREAGLAKSNGEARRLIRGGGARINDVPVQTEDQSITLEDLGPDNSIKLSAGKKRHVLIVASLKGSTD